MALGTRSNNLTPDIATVLNLTSGVPARAKKLDRRSLRELRRNYDAPSELRRNIGGFAHKYRGVASSGSLLDWTDTLLFYSTNTTWSYDLAMLADLTMMLLSVRY